MTLAVAAVKVEDGGGAGTRAALGNEKVKEGQSPT